jgi:proteasome assembly chaperone (PAC2) family protein
MWFEISEKRRPRLRRPAMLVALSTSIPQYRGLYSQARELGRHLMDSLPMEEVATIHSSSLGPEVIVQEDGLSRLPSCHLNSHKGRRDFLLLTGDGSPVDDQEEFAERVLDYASRLGVNELYSVGARWTETPMTPYQQPEANGFATDRDGAKKLRRAGVKLIENEPAPFFASLVVGLAARRGIAGFKISVDHGEPLPHTRAVISIAEVLGRLLLFDPHTKALVPETAGPPPPQQYGDPSIYH